MQYFDKKLQKSRLIKRSIGYVGAVLIIVSGTLLMVYAAKGWGIDAKSKQLVLSGLVNLEVLPSDSVKLKINSDEPKEVSESNRLTLPGGQHLLSLTAEGMTPWQKYVSVLGGEIIELPKARLYPLRPLSQVYEGFDKFTSVWSNNDQSKFYIKTPGTSLTSVQFSIYNPKLSYTTANTEKPSIETINLRLSDTPVLGIFEDMKIANDGNHYLIRQKTEGFNFYRGDLSKPEVKAEELTKYFGLKFTDIWPIDDRSEQMAALDENRNIRILDFNAKTASAPVASNVALLQKFDDIFIVRKQLIAGDANSTRSFIYDSKFENYVRIVGTKQSELAAQTTPLIGDDATDCQYRRGSQATVLFCRAGNTAYIYRDLKLAPRQSTNESGAESLFMLPDATTELTKLGISPSGQNIIMIGATGLARSINTKLRTTSTSQLHNYSGATPIYWLDDDNIIYQSQIDGHLVASDLDAQNAHDFAEQVAINPYVITGNDSIKAFAYLSGNLTADKAVKLTIIDISKPAPTLVK